MTSPNKEPGALDRYPNLSWLFALQRFGINAGLETMLDLTRALGSPEQSFKSVLVGGTNGKGSVARLLAGALSAAGHRTGLYVSPHLQQVGERIAVDGVLASEEELERVLEEVRPNAEALGASFFEVITAAALLRFQDLRVEWAVLEVGMGGRLDATNIVEPHLSVVTNVALDHTGVLGDTVEEIAHEKAGIMRAGVPLVTAVTGLPEQVLSDAAQHLEAPLLRLGHEFTFSGGHISWEGVSLTLRCPTLLWAPLALSAPLVGRHQLANVAVAAVAALKLEVAPPELQWAFAQTHWPGRLERFSYRGRRVILDGAHNAEAAQALASALRELEGEVGVLIVGMSREKDSAAIIEALAPLARQVIITAASHSPRAFATEELVGKARDALSNSTGAAPRSGGEGKGEVGLSTQATPTAALAAAVAQSAPGQTVVIAGSLFLVGEVRNIMEGKAEETVERWQ